MTFFPQLIAGPIVHHKEMMPQFEEAKTYIFSWENLSVGMTYFGVGLFKKMLIADKLSEKVGLVYKAADSGSLLTTSDAWLGTLCYTFQIYFDFSGYCDMAIGLGFMFGIMLPLNFNSPYKAISIVDFWRRWHITLSRFLRDYLYIPLGGNRKGPARRYVNLIITMLFGGLWHGAGWAFALWGLLHGAYLVVNHMMSRVGGGFGLLVSNRVRMWTVRVLTFLAVVIAWVLFRAESLSGAMTIYGSMLGLGGSVAEGTSVLIRSNYWVSCGLLMVLVWLLPNTQEVFNNFRKREEFGDDPGIILWRPNYMWSIGMGLVLTICILSLTEISEFLYYQF